MPVCASCNQNNPAIAWFCLACGQPMAEGGVARQELIARQTVSALEGEQQYTFNHVLVRDVAYELLAPWCAAGAA